MNKVLCIFFITLLLLSITLSPVVTAQAESNIEISLLRAGGGSGGGGSSGGSGGSGGGSHASGGSGSYGSGGGYYGFTRRQSVLGDILGYALCAVILSGSALVFRFKLSKSARNSRKLMKMLDNKDSAWKYKNILSQVRKTYFSVQNAWNSLNLDDAKEHMSDELYKNFRTKLDWMKYRKQQNVLKNIRLLEVVPVSVYDSEDDSLDYIWFYIKGRMIDYIIDTESQEKISGNDLPEKFVEYWKFTRKENGQWVLDKILQENEKEQIIFQ